jgi:competence ComEA-like helix-hairpin-helix protein
VPTGTAYRHASSIQTEINYFHFDPNGLPAEKWQELGFSAKQAKAIKNYEANGGKFYRKEDVAKLYVISDEDYARLAPYIVIPHVTRKVEYKEPVTVTPKNSDRKPELLDINLADTTEFKSMRGIGSILAQRTVKYREALGGFHDIGQVAEVYGISPELFENIRPFLRLHSMEITKLNVNSAAVEDLAKHPYISKKQARLIVNYRTQHGAYTDFSDLQKIHALDDDFFRKIAPYIEW